MPAPDLNCKLNNTLKSVLDDSHASNYHKSHTITNGNQAQTSHYSITTMQTILKSYQKQNDDSSYESSDTQLTTVSDDDTALVNNGKKFF